MRKQLTIHRIRTAIIILLFGVLFYSCSDSPTSTKSGAQGRGGIDQTTNMGSYSAQTIEAFARNEYGFSIDFAYNIDVIKIEYKTIDWDGNETLASGVLVVPNNAESLPIISLQHGTVFQRDEVASAGVLDSREGLVGIAFASYGYLTLLPDYLGYGASHIMHPYLHAAGNANVVIDFIRAAKNWAENNRISLNGQVFLGGYSEGGYITLATQRAIETNPAVDISLAAVAPGAGPYDLFSTVQDVGQRLDYPQPAFLCYMLTAYNEIYNWNMLNTIFQSPYGDQMPGLFDGTTSSDEIDHALPDSINQILTQKFISGIVDGDDTTVLKAVHENTLLDWTPVAPIRFYQGESDKIVDPQNAITAQRELKSNGGEQISLVTYPNLGHVDAAAATYRDMFDWFGSFVQDSSGSGSKMK